MRFLRRVWSVLTGGTRPPTAVELVHRADRERREGRLEEALTLTQDALAHDPSNLLGHLLAAGLHAAFRRTDLARSEYRAVLRLDRQQPRALLGLARISLEEGDPAACRGLLTEALHVYPDFPEARALLDVVSTMRAPAEVTATPGRIERLPLPVGSRECVVTRPDGSVVFAYPSAGAAKTLGGHLVRLSRVATATLARAGLGALEEAVIESSAGATYIRSDSRLILALTLPRDVAMGTGHRHLDGLWDRCVAEMGLEEV